jgi:ABC-2 type transport system ATP-binding protein
LSARRLLRETIRETRAAGKTVILVSHALADVAELCDRVAVLRSGRIQYLGAPQELAPRLDAAISFEEALQPLYEGSCA